MYALYVSKFSAASIALVQRIGDWLEISRQRRQLAALDERMLKDVGLNRATAEREASRPFWDLPDRYDTERTDGRQSGIESAATRLRSEFLHECV